MIRPGSSLLAGWCSASPRLRTWSLPQSRAAVGLTSCLAAAERRCCRAPNASSSGPADHHPLTTTRAHTPPTTAHAHARHTHTRTRSLLWPPGLSSLLRPRRRLVRSEWIHGATSWRRCALAAAARRSSASSSRSSAFSASLSLRRAPWFARRTSASPSREQPPSNCQPPTDSRSHTHTRRETDEAHCAHVLTHAACLPSFVSRSCRSPLPI